VGIAYPQLGEMYPEPVNAMHPNKHS